MKVRSLREVRDDIRSTVRHYDRQKPGLGQEFRLEVRALIDRIKTLPESCPVLEGDLRQGMTSRFPYGIIYRLMPDEIVILSVSHLHRDPDHWRNRL